MESPPATSNGSLRGGRLSGLDGLRAIAVTGVMLYHFRDAEGFPTWPGIITFATVWGLTAVPLFFVLSGFLITHLLLREESDSGRVHLWHFYARRALRILPPAFCYLGVIAILTLTVGLTVRPVELAASALWFRNFLYHGWWGTWALQLPPGAGYTNHFWSLSVEEHFYLIWPAGFALAGLRRRFLGLAILLSLLPIWRALNLAWFGVAGINYWRTDFVADYLTGGALLALAQARWGHLPAWQKFWNISAPILMAGGVAMLAFRYFGPATGPLWKGSVLLEVTVTMLALVAVVRWAAIGGSSWVHQWLNCRPMVWLGGISYSLYLWQQLFSGKELPSQWQAFPNGVLLSLLAASLSHYLVERPFLRMRSRFRHATPTDTPPEPPVDGKDACGVSPSSTGSPPESAHLPSVPASAITDRN